jgi:hypothetical protein
VCWTQHAELPLLGSQNVAFSVEATHRSSLHLPAAQRQRILSHRSRPARGRFPMVTLRGEGTSRNRGGLFSPEKRLFFKESFGCQRRVGSRPSARLCVGGWKKLAGKELGRRIEGPEHACMHGTRTLDMTMDAWAWDGHGARARGTNRAKLPSLGGPTVRRAVRAVHSESKSKQLGTSTPAGAGHRTGP